MFSPDRFGARSRSFSSLDPSAPPPAPYIGLKTAFGKGASRGRGGAASQRGRLTPLQEAAHFRYSEPTTPSVLKARGLRPSDLSDPNKKDFLTKLTTKVFHFALDSEEEQHEKIPLQRLFTPATDAGEIVPHKKKAFASSCFYRPDHPTIDDQVELAHKISVSLVDENNKTSKGQNMYMKRKNRSSKWVHQGEEAEMLAASQFEMEQDAQQDKMPVKPALKLLMNPKGAMHDFNSMQQHEEHHSEELKASSQTTQAITRMEVGMEIASNLESPTGKGAALFAKRKKRMDKFIVDETTVQHQSPSSSSSFSAAADQSTETTMQVSSTSAMQQQQHSSFSSTTTQQGQQQLSTQFNQTMLPQINGPSSTQMPAINQPGALHQLPELSQILTQPQPFEKTPSSLPSRSSGRSKPASSRSHSADSKPFSHFNSPSSQKPKEKSQRRERENKKGVSFGPFSASYNNIAQEIQDPLIDVRPGSPPVFLVPDGTGEFIERKPEVELFNHINETTEATTNNEGGAIYTAEVKVVQNTSLPTTPVIDFSVSNPSTCSILDNLPMSKEEDKRKSFNLAPKGWGTYNNFYTPVHLEAR